MDILKGVLEKRMKRILMTVLASFMLLFTAPAAMIASASSADTVISNAKKHMGTPYRWGGTRPGGFDCSGYTQYVFKQSGISIPRTTGTQFNAGPAVSKANLQTGDLVFFNTSGRGVSHVGIYISGGKFIHASTSKGVEINSINDPYYWGKRYIGARRVSNFQQQAAQKAQPAAPTVQYATRGKVAEILSKELNLQAQSNTTFTDVSSSHPQFNVIVAAADAGIFSGDNNGQFKPNDHLTRGQLAKVLVEAYGLTGSTSQTFTDVSPSHWAHGYINTLAANGITTGYSNGKFGINDKVTEKDFMVFVSRAK